MNNSVKYNLDSRVYLFGLLVLFLNDFFLKSMCHNWMTGKLSDLVGLFLMTAFLLSVLKLRSIIIEAIVVISFVLWKSSLSAGFIEWWSASFYAISRVVDYTDLVCLMIVPLTKHILVINTKRIRIHPIFPLFVSIFLFGATSYENNIEESKIHHFEVNRDDLLTNMKTLEFLDTNFSVLSGDTLKMCVLDPYCFESFDTYVVLKETTPFSSQIEVIRYNHGCPSNSTDIYGVKNRDDKKELSDIFQTKIIRPLKLRTTNNKRH